MVEPGLRFDRDALEIALAAAGVGVWTWSAATGRVRWSAQTAQLFGLAAAAFEGGFDDFSSRIHPDDRAQVLAAVEHAMATGAQEFICEHRVVHDGPTRWVHGRGRVVFDSDGRPSGMVGAILEITALKAQSEQLRASEERHRLYAELASDFVYVVDPRVLPPVPTIVAGSFARVTGYAPDELPALRTGWLELVHPDDRSILRELAAQLDAGRTVIVEYRIIAKNGEVRWLRDRAQAVPDPVTGAVDRIVGGVQDITDRRQLEVQLAHANKLDALARMAGSVAHDFNNLLTVMMMTSTTLAARAAAPEAAADLQTALDRAAQLTGALLTFAHRRPLKLEVGGLDDAITTALPMVRRAVAERVHVTFTASTNERVAIDHTQFEMILLNLAINARDAMPAGGDLSLHTRRVELTTEAATRIGLAPGAYAAITVTDTGPGIAPEIRGRLFEPFVTTKDPGMGTGLGLATTHGSVRQFGGAIQVTSPAGAGATFLIYLPISTGTLSPKLGNVLHHAVVGGSERLVVIEDEDILRRALERLLVQLGYEVAAFASAEDALAAPDKLGTCDLLISDVRLPGIPGTELAKRVVADRPTLRVLLMSGHVEAPEDRATIESGRFTFVNKPFLPADLARRIRAMLDDDTTTVDELR